MAASLLDAGGGEFVELAAGLPISVIGDIVGIPDEDRPRVFDLIDQVLRLAGVGLATPEGDALGPFLELFQYASELTAQKRAHPVDDIWSTLCTAEIDDESGGKFLLPENELEISSSSSHWPGATLRVTRYATASAPSSRTPHRPIDTAGIPTSVRVRWRKYCGGLRRSSSGFAALAATSCWVIRRSRRAPASSRCFARPIATKTSLTIAFDFDIAREHNPHVAFGGGGAHHCLGAMLARAEIRAALDEILLNTADIGLSEPTIQHPSITSNMTVYESLPISLELAKQR